MRTAIRWEKPAGTKDQRFKSILVAPSNKLTEEERIMILETANSPEYCDLPPCKIVPSLADKGIYIASESSFYRILKAEKQLTHRQHSKVANRYKPTPYVATAANQLWSWDISYLSTTITRLFYYPYVIIDIYSRKIVGWNIHEKESSEHGSALVKQACLDEKVQQDQLVLHSDNGKPMKGMMMLGMLEMLGVIPSFSRPSVSDDNPYSESLFKTIKYHPSFPIITKFETIVDARIWMEKFVKWYNTEHMHSGLKFVTPEQRHLGLDKDILNNRQQVYLEAKQQHPERWSGNTRNWELPDFITLNPNKKNKITDLDKEECNEILMVA